MSDKRFCPLPWINLSLDVNGSTRPCCRYHQPNRQQEYKLPFIKEDKLDRLYNNQQWQNLRQAFIDGVEPSECKMCWDDEAGGVKSYRQNFVESKNIDITNVNFNSTTVQSPITLDLKLNNVCNLKCRICGPQASSTYAKEHKILYPANLLDYDYWTQDKITNTTHEEVLVDWANHIQHIEMTGGEPMNSPENVKVLKLINDASTLSDKTMLINTNVTQWNQSLINYLLKFKKSTLCLSVDDLYERQEYHRFPSKWQDITKNVDKFISLTQQYNNIEVILFCTVSVFNVYFLNEYQEWADSKGLTVYYNLLHTHEKYCIRNLPNPAKKEVESKLNNTFTKVINFLQLPRNEYYWQQFCDEVENLDEFREQNFVNTYPQWSKILGIM